MGAGQEGVFDALKSFTFSPIMIGLEKEFIILVSELEKRLTSLRYQKDETYQDVIRDYKRHCIAEDRVKEIVEIFEFRKVVMGSLVTLSDSWINKYVLKVRKTLANLNIP